MVTSSDPGAQPALWVGSTDPGNNIQVQFTTLPTQLSTSGGAHVPFACGNQAGVITVASEIASELTAAGFNLVRRRGRTSPARMIASDAAG